MSFSRLKWDLSEKYLDTSQKKVGSEKKKKKIGSKKKKVGSKADKHTIWCLLFPKLVCGMLNRNIKILLFKTKSV